MSKTQSKIVESCCAKSVAKSLLDWKKPLKEMLQELNHLEAFNIEEEKDGFSVAYNGNDVRPSRHRHRSGKKDNLHNEEGIRYLHKIYTKKGIKP